MMKDLIRHLATETGLTQKAARAALGTVLSAAERRGSPFTSALFKRLPGARTLSARTGSETGAPTGVIAQLIEQTPGGKRHVSAGMLRQLHDQGLGHREVGKLLPAIAVYTEDAYGISALGHLGDLVANDMASEARATADAEARAA
ncbi:MAG: hypothetical protein AAFR41_13310 [Pseudomonadota bacterium]